MKKKNKLIMVMISSLTIFILCLFSISFLNNGNVKYSLEKIYNNEYSKYQNILNNEDLNEIYNYFDKKMQNNEYIPIPVLDKIYEQLLSSRLLNEDEIYDFFAIYHYNRSLYLAKYNSLINNYSSDIINQYKNIDLNDISDVNNIDNLHLRTLLIEMNLSHVYTLKNDIEIKVYYDYSYFSKKFYFPQEYKDFMELDTETSKTIVNPKMVDLDYDAIIDIIYKHEQFILNHDNINVNKMVQYSLEEYLGLASGLTDIGYTYQNDDNTLTDTYRYFYDLFYQKYPDSKSLDFIREIDNYLVENPNENITDTLPVLYYNFVNNSDWLPSNTSYILDDFELTHNE